MAKLFFGFLIAGASLILLFLLATSELNFKDFTFATYFALFSTLGAIGFFVITRNEDNEETNPAKEKRFR